MQNSYLRLLMDEPPLLVLPSLAVAIGLKEAIILQQLHYWLQNTDRAGNRTAHFRDDQWWVYNSYDKWQRTNFPFLSLTTLRRKFDRLEHELHLITSRQFGLSAGDGEKWYSIDYGTLSALAEDHQPASTPPVHDVEQGELHFGRKARWQRCPASFLRQCMAALRERLITVPDSAVQAHVAKLLWADGWSVPQIFEVFDWLHSQDRSVNDSLLTVRKHIGSYFYRDRVTGEPNAKSYQDAPALTLSSAEREQSRQRFDAYYETEDSQATA